jgi:hypothetical protein
MLRVLCASGYPLLKDVPIPQGMCTS